MAFTFSPTLSLELMPTTGAASNFYVNTCITATTLPGCTRLVSKYMLVNDFSVHQLVLVQQKAMSKRYVHIHNI